MYVVSGEQAIYVAYSALLYMSVKHANKRLYHGVAALLIALLCAGGLANMLGWGVACTPLAVVFTLGVMAYRPAVHRYCDSWCV